MWHSLKWINSSSASHVRGGTFHHQPLSIRRLAERFIPKTHFLSTCYEPGTEPAAVVHVEYSPHETLEQTAMPMTHTTSGAKKQRGVNVEYYSALKEMATEP